MLGRKDYTQEEFANAKAGVGQSVAAYADLLAAIADAPADREVDVAMAQLETPFFNSMVLVLDRYFVYRLRIVTGKDANPLNEVEMLADSLMNNDGVLQVGNVIKWAPGHTVLKLKVGDMIELSATDFERLSAAFFTDLENKFL